MHLRRVYSLVSVCVSLASIEFVVSPQGMAYVELMAGQQARPLNGTFNNVPVLHSNQPEIVTGQGILVDTAPGQATRQKPGNFFVMPLTPSMVHLVFICTINITHLILQNWGEVVSVDC